MSTESEERLRVIGRYVIRERHYVDRTEVAVIDEMNSDELGSVKVYIDSSWPYAQPDIGDAGARAIGDPNLVLAIAAMFDRAAEVLRAVR